jgi:hypothetical protein
MRRASGTQYRTAATCSLALAPASGRVGFLSWPGAEKDLARAGGRFGTWLAGYLVMASAGMGDVVSCCAEGGDAGPELVPQHLVLPYEVIVVAGDHDPLVAFDELLEVCDSLHRMNGGQ